MCICNTAHAPASQIPWSGLRPDTPPSPHGRALNCAPVHRFSRIFLAYLCVQHGVKRFGLIVQVLTAAGSLIQIHLLEPLKEEKCLCADKFGGTAEFGKNRTLS
uniref:hypothetical protein n=1 Tax=Escherichia coli TaxID=562 RepID=UPI003EBA2FF6